MRHPLPTDPTRLRGLAAGASLGPTSLLALLELFAAFPQREGMLHHEPAGLEDARLDQRIAVAAARTGT